MTVIFLTIAIAILLLLLAGATVYMLRFACVRRSDSISVWESPSMFRASDPLFEKLGADVTAAREALYAAGKSAEELTLTSADGLSLKGRLIPSARSETVGVILMLHGYRSNPTVDFGGIAVKLTEMGFAILLADQRAHGASEGRYITYGVKERYDAVGWCEILAERFPELPIMLLGLSMGASTVLMASSLPLPKNVRAVVADCGYTTPDAICRKVMREDLHIPTFPLLHTTKLLARLAAGFSFDGASAADSAAASPLPILLFHGEGDRFVPHSMAEEIAEKTGERCKLYSVPEAGHGRSYVCDPDGYLEAFKSFSLSTGFRII